jgi:hypothetical protein
MEVCYKSKGLNFKWVSPITGGETLGVISELRVLTKYYSLKDLINDIKCEEYYILSSHEQTYSLDECEVEISGVYKKINGVELCN